MILPKLENPASRARKATGLTQEAFAAQYRVALSTLRNHEQGRVKSNLDVYYELIAAHPVEIFNLLRRTATSSSG